MLNPLRDPPPRSIVRLAGGTLLLIAAALVLAVIYFRPTVGFARGSISPLGAPRTPTASSRIPVSKWVTSASVPLPAQSFTSISTALTMGEVIARLGPARADVGSGVFVLQWAVTDGRIFHVSTPELSEAVHPVHVGFAQQ